MSSRKLSSLFVFVLCFETARPVVRIMNDVTQPGIERTRKIKAQKNQTRGIPSLAVKFKSFVNQKAESPDGLEVAEEFFTGFRSQ